MIAVEDTTAIQVTAITEAVDTITMVAIKRSSEPRTNSHWNNVVVSCESGGYGSQCSGGYVGGEYGGGLVRPLLEKGLNSSNDGSSDNDDASLYANIRNQHTT